MATMAVTIASPLSLLGGASSAAAGFSHLSRHGRLLEHSIPTVRASLPRRRLVSGSSSQQQKMWVNCVGLNSGVAMEGRQSKQAGGASGAVVEKEKEKEVAILWFKHDLRLDDHPGVVAAVAEYKHVLPVFNFDPHVCAGWSKELLESLFDAVVDLRRSLRLLGSDLAILTGRTADVLSPFAQKIGASSIICEEEVEFGWREVEESVAESLKNVPSADNPVRLKSWCASLYDTEKVEAIPDSYKDFQRLGLRITKPLEVPSCFPDLPENISLGSLPDFDEFSGNVDAIRGENPWWGTLKAAQEQPAETLQPQVKGNLSKVSVQPAAGQTGVFKNLIEWREKYILESPQESLLKKQGGGDLEEVEVIGKYIIKGGATGASDVLDAYLRFLEPTSRADWQAVYEHIWEMEKKPGASFRTLFGSSLALGTLSRRRVFFEALKYETERNGGRLSPFGFSTFTVGAAINDMKSMEWFELLQKKSEKQGREKGFHVGAWRWRGYHVQYSSMGNEGPAVLLVHGFGAFWEHYRDNLKGLAAKGYRVWALTLVGFGRSEKPNITYTELTWAELVRDFIVEVVQEPVVLAGNSIGGFTTTIVAGLWPSLVTSLVLLNTAGKVVPDYKGLTYQKPRESSAIAKPVSKLLLFYLQTSSDRLLTQCYPTQESRVDSWLLSEVKRSGLQHSICTLDIRDHALKSYDPGNTTVLESIFLLKAPLPLNFYLDKFKGNVFVIQGTRDPLQKKSKRAAMLQALCSNVTVKYLEAGHCPHDELPDEVNNLVHEFVRTSPLAKKPSGGVVAGDKDEGAAGVADVVREEVNLIKEDLLTRPAIKRN